MFCAFLSAQTHKLLVVLGRKTVFFNKPLFVLHHITIQANENFHTKRKREKQDKTVQVYTVYRHRHQSKKS